MVTKGAKKQVKKVTSTSKAKIVKKKVVKAKPIKKVSEVEMIDESLGLLKSLNEKVLLAHKAKEKLQKDVLDLKKKVTSHVTPKVSSELTSLKKDILNDFAPLLKKIDIKKIKTHVLSDFTSLIDKELSKIRVEVQSNFKKTDKESKKMFSTLEIKLLDSLKGHAMLKKELAMFDGKEVKSLITKVEKKLQSSLLKSEKKLSSDLKSTFLRVQELEKELKVHTASVKKTATQIKAEKTQFSKTLQSEGIDISSIESKILKLGKEFKALHSLVGRFENDLYAKESKKKTEVEKKVSKELKKVENLVSSFNSEKQAQEDFLTEKLNTIISEVSLFEKKIASLEKTNEKTLNKIITTELSENVKESKKKLFEETKKELQNFKEKVQHDFSAVKIELTDFVTEHIAKFNLKVEDFESSNNSQIDVFQSTTSNLSEKVLSLNKDFNRLHSFVKTKQKDLSVLGKNLESDVKNTLDDLKISLSKENEDVFDTFVQESKEYFDSNLKKFKLEFKIFSRNVVNEKKENLMKINSLEHKFSEFEEFIQRDLNLLTQQFEGIDAVSTSFNESLFKESEKIETIEKTLNTFQEFFSKFQNEFNSYKNLESNKLAQTFSELENSVETRLQDFSKLKEGYDAYFAEKMNSMFVEIQDFETRLESVEKRDFKEVHQQLKEELQKELKVFQKGISTSSQENYFKLKEDTTSDFEKLKEKHDFLLTNLTNFKDESQKLFKDYVTELDSELKTLKMHSSQHSKIEDEKIKVVVEKLAKFEKTYVGIEEFISSKYNELVSHFETLSRNTEVDLTSYKKELNLSNVGLIDEEIKRLKEENSLEILKYQDHITRSNTELKENEREVRESLEESFSHLKNEFNSIFKSQLYSYEEDLIKRESDYISKLTKIESDKNEVVSELQKLHLDISSQSKKFDEKLEKDLVLIEEKELDFDKKKNDFINSIDSIAHVRRIQLEEDFKLLESKVGNVVEDAKDYFLEEDNSFRNTFASKISNLKEVFENKVESLEKKFVHKNVKKIKDELVPEMEKLHIYEENIQSQSEELSLRMHAFEQKELDFFENLQSEHSSLQERVEERTMNLEKQFNKRFLDFDLQFGEFKSIVIEEVEDLMKEVNGVVTQKFDSLKTQESKLKFIVSEGEKRISEFGNVRSIVEEELAGVRDEVQSLRVQFDLQDSNNEIGSVQNMVSTMSEYETHLMGLIDTLKEKGIPSSQIKRVLVSKGHPLVYTTMLLKIHDPNFLKQ